MYAHWDENNLAQGKYFPAEESYEKIIISPSSLLYNQTEQGPGVKQLKNPLPHQAKGTSSSSSSSCSSS
jgi:hypothetical protein